MPQSKHRSAPKGSYRWGFSDPEEHVERLAPGLNEDTVKAISGFKNEPDWMRSQRLQAYRNFLAKPLPEWGADLTELRFEDITYFLRSTKQSGRSWDEVPDSIRNTFERIGVPEAERDFLAGVSAQYESEAVYHNLRQEWQTQGVIFTDMDTALREHPDLVKKYFGSVVPSADNKLAALNSAVWSGGSFVYVPAGVKVNIPLQSYFRINAKAAGQFERTLIVAEAGSYVHYVEGCSAPIYSTDSLHAAVVEVIVKDGARVRYTTIQNWSNNVYNLVTKRAVARKNAVMEWVDCNLGSKVTMKYPCTLLAGEGARAEMLSLAAAGPGQHHDTGAKMIHLAPRTSSLITSKSISWGGGRSSYRGLVRGSTAVKESTSRVSCDALLLDGQSRSDTYPTIEVANETMEVEHEASISKIEDIQMFYLRSRGISEEQAISLLVNGFLEPVIKELPMEYAVELNRLIELQMEGSVG